MKEFSEDGRAQFIMATHSPILMACPNAKLLSFDKAPIDEVNYEETAYYRFYKDFMKDRDRFLP